MNNTICPIAKLGNLILLIHYNDLPILGKEINLKCIQVDFDNKSIDEPWEIEKHFKFNPWEIIEDVKEREVVWQKISAEFSEQEIKTKIIEPLEKNMINVNSAI